MSIAGPDEAQQLRRELDLHGSPVLDVGVGLGSRAPASVERLRPFAGIPTGRLELRHRHLLASIERVRRVVEGDPLASDEDRLRRALAQAGCVGGVPLPQGRRA